MTTITELQQKITELETAQVEANLLYQNSQRLNSAQSEADLLAVMAQPGLDLKVTWAALFHIIDLDQAENPAWAEVSASWPAGGGSPLPVGMRYALAQFPYTALWLQNPTEPLFIADVLNEHRLNQPSRTAMAQGRSRALAVIPLRQAGRWVGLALLSWDAPHSFTSAETTILGAFTNLAAPFVESQRLQSQQKEPLVETLYQISRRLNTAGDDEELLKILTQPSLEAGVTVSALVYLDLDETGQPAWAEIVATWQREGARATAVLIAAIWSQIVATRQQQGQPPLSTGTRYYLPEFPFTGLWLASPSEPQLIADVTTDYRVDPPIKNILSEAGLRAMAAIPLVHTGRWMGLINLFWDKPHAFSEQEIAVYRAFTNLAGPIVSNRRQVTRLARQVDAQRTEAAHFRALAENGTEAIAITDLNGVYTYANRAYYHLLGYDPHQAELIGRSIAALLPRPEAADEEHYNEESRRQFVQTLLDGWQGEQEIQGKDNKIVPVQLTSFILQDENGDPVQLALLGRDLSRRQQTETLLTTQRRLTTTVAAEDDLSVALQQGVEAALEISRLERGRLYLADPAGEGLTLAAHQNIPDPLLTSVNSFGPEAPPTRILQPDAPLYADAATVGARPLLTAGDAELQTVVILPLTYRQEQLGGLHLGGTGTEMPPEAAAIALETIAAQLGQALGQNRQEQRLQQNQARLQANLVQIQTQAETQLQQANQEATARLAELQAELETTRSQAQTELDATRTDLHTTLQESHTETETVLNQTADQARAALKQLNSHLLASLQQTQQQTQAELAATQAQAEAALQQTNEAAEARLAEAQTELKAARSQAQAELEMTRTKAEAALQQAKEQSQARLARARADLAAAHTQAQTELKVARTESAARLNQTRTEAAAALEQTAALARAALKQLNSHLLASLQQTHQQTQADLAATQAEAQRQLDRQNQDQAQLLTALSNWVYQIDLEGRFTAANPASQALLGYEPAELIGQSMFDYIHPSERDWLRELFQQAIAQEFGWSEITLSWLHKEGGKRPCQNILQPLTDPQGQLLGFRAINHDLTLQHRLQSWAKIHRELLETLASTSALDEILPHALDAAIRATGLEQGRLYLLDPASGELTLTAYQNISADLLAHLTRFEADAPPARVLTNGVRYADYAAINAEPDLVAGDPTLQAAAIVPVYYKQEQLAALHLGSAERQSAPVFAPVPLETIAAYLGQLIAHRQAAQRWQEAQEQARTELAAARAQAEANLQAARLEAETRLEQLQHQAQESWSQVRTTATTGLQRSQTESQNRLAATQAGLQTALQAVQTENQVVLQTIQQQAEAELAETQSQAEAERLYFTTHLRTAAEVGEQINAQHRPETLLAKVANLLQTQLGLDHVLIYTVDQERRELGLQSCAGPQAARLEAEGHTIPLDYRRSLVSGAARSQQIRLANNAAAEPNFTPHPLLPHTQAQMAIPLTSGERLLGVLDLQDKQTDRFDPIEIDAFNSLAGYLAAALANIELRDAQKRAAAERVAFKQQLVEVQKQAIQSLPTPVIPLMSAMIAIPLIGQIDAVRTRTITQAMQAGIKQYQAKLVVLDVSGAPPLEGKMADYLNQIIQAARLQDVQTIVTGLPEAESR